MAGLEKHLRNIKAKVKATHWIKGNYRRPDFKDASKTCYCLAGLINVEAGLYPSALAGRDFLYPYRDYDGNTLLAYNLGTAVFDSIQELFPTTKAETIEEWNDQHKRTRKDVVAVLDLAIRREAASKSHGTVAKEKRNK